MDNQDNEDYTPQQLQAYEALRVAAERIWYNNWVSQGKPMPDHKGHSWFHVTYEHKHTMELMPMVLSGKVSPEEAMAWLWDYDTMKQRGIS
jgi:hypothetical protein